jgi:hypothetical protein
LIWFGSQLPWPNVLAVRSAAMRAELERVTLHHDEDLSGTPYYAELVATPRVECLRFDADRVFSRCGGYGPRLAEVFGHLSSAVMRSDLLRLALLYGQGGIYLDIDTVTIASLRTLYENDEAFCGEERIVYTAAVRASRNPLTRGKALARSLLRAALRRAPSGQVAFGRVAGLYPAAINNAILASAPRGAFVTSLIEAVLALPVERQRTLYALGPHLLQAAAPHFAPPALRVHPPEVFYPLGPEICAHWFRAQKRVDLGRFVSAQTRVVHWYGSTSGNPSLQTLTPAHVLANADREPWSALALPFVHSDST